MEILNMTPHKINIFTRDQVQEKPEIRKLVVKPGENPVLELESNGMLNARIEYKKFDSVQGIDLYKMNITSCDEIPRDADIVIVLALYASAAQALKLEGVEKLYTVSQPVYSSGDNPRPIGCLGLNKVTP